MSKWGCCNIETGQNEEIIDCMDCNKSFHLACLSIPGINETEMLSNWNCPQCKNNAPRCSKQDSTPLRNINTGRGTKRPALNSPPNTTALTGADVKNIVQDVIRTELSGILKEINNSLMEIINKELKPIKKEMKEINESMNFINNRFEDIEKEQAEAKKTSKELLEDNLKMKSIVSELNMRLLSAEQRVNITEQHLRANNLELHCVPESRNENLISIIQKLGTVVGYTVKENDIIHCTRTAKISPATKRPRSIVVQLSSQFLRDQFLASIIKFNKNNHLDKLNSSHLGLSGTKTAIYVVEHLSPSNKALHAATRIKAKEKGFKYVWIGGGKTYVRKNDESQYIVIKDLGTLNKLM